MGDNCDINIYTFIHLGGIGRSVVVASGDVFRAIPRNNVDLHGLQTTSMGLLSPTTQKLMDRLRTRFLTLRTSSGIMHIMGCCGRQQKPICAAPLPVEFAHINLLFDRS
jgi:hypothetical protein